MAVEIIDMDCRVVVEAAVPVYDVETADEAVRIAISKTGEMLNPDLNYVEINMGERVCPHCAEELEPAFLAADESLVALELEMTVFNVERDEHASRIARKEIGQLLENIPLDVLEVEELPDEDDEETGTDEAVEDDESIAAEEVGEAEEAAGEVEEADEEADEPEMTPQTEGGTDSGSEGSGDDEDVLPEFEDLIDD